MKLLSALRGENQGRPPVWLMRQAGRYLPEYRSLRAQHSLRELFFTPHLAARVTHMPLARFPLDAAILFSDITVTALALGLSLDFNEGPRITPAVTPATPLVHRPEALAPIYETIQILKADLTVPLLGFCGAPFTVATYLIGDLPRTLTWMRSDPAAFRLLLDQIAHATSHYLYAQQTAGVDAVQIFDSWANVLTPEEFRLYSLPYLKQLTKAVTVPSIFFMRGISSYLEEIPCALSLDWEISPAAARLRTAQPLQGNLNPDLLFAPLPVLREKIKELLSQMQGDPAFIFNLGHGIKPGTPVEAVQALVEMVLDKTDNPHAVTCVSKENDSFPGKTI